MLPCFPRHHLASEQVFTLQPSYVAPATPKMNISEATTKTSPFIATDERCTGNSPNDQQEASRESHTPNKKTYEGSNDRILQRVSKPQTTEFGCSSVRNSPNGGGSGNNSDNSENNGLDNNYFGFNFDAEEGVMNNSLQNSEDDRKNDSDCDSVDGDSNNETSQLDNTSHAEAAATAVANLQSIVSAYNLDGASHPSCVDDF